MTAKAIRPQRASGGLELGGHGAKSEAVRERAILALLSEKTLGAAADKANIDERTLRRWLTEDATFKDEYDTARTATFQAGINRVQGHASSSALRERMVSGDPWRPPRRRPRYSRFRRTSANDSAPPKRASSAPMRARTSSSVVPPSEAMTTLLSAGGQR